MRLDGKIALVTGASSGIGAATAALLAERGARVLTAQRRPAGFEDIEANLMDPDSPAMIMEHLHNTVGGLDILVNNAGLMREGTVEETSTDDWNAQIHMNLSVPFLLIRGAMPLLRAAKGAGLKELESTVEDPWIGRVLGLWKLTARLGTGGMGAVFVGERDDGQYEHQAAVKVMGTQLLGEMAKQRIGQAQIALCIFEVNGIDLMGHRR